MNDESNTFRRPTLTAMLAWFDETTEYLAHTVNDLERLGVSQIVAVDGAYALYPTGTARSSWSQGHSLRAATERAGMRLILVEPAEVWGGNEVEKRQYMLNLAVASSQPGDWLVAWDADFVMEACPDDVIGELATCPHMDAFVDISFSDAPVGVDSWYPLRNFMHAQSGMRMSTNHYSYILPSGQLISVGDRTSCTSLSFKDRLKVRHRTEDRGPERRGRQKTYYERRDKGRIER